MRRKMLLSWALIALGIGLATSVFATEGTPRDGRGAIFVMTNSTDPVRGNEIGMYDRSKDGDLSLVGFFPTGELSEGKPQLGSGPAPTMRIFHDFTPPLPYVVTNLDGLGSSNSVILSPDNQCLFAVNAGSNSLSSFRVRRSGLSLVSIEGSQGTFPVSLTLYRDTLFVLNSGLQGAVAALQVADDCSLTPIKNSVVSLSGLSETYPLPAPGENLTTPGQISFAPDGALFLVSIKGGFPNNSPPGPFPGVFPNGKVVVYPVIGKGRLGSPVVTPFDFAAGRGGPFSFVFTGPRTLAMVHVNSSTVAAYSINSSNKLTVLTGPIQTQSPTGHFHFATCWIVLSGNYVYSASFDEPSGVLQIMGGPGTPPSPDLDGAIDGFQILKSGPMKGGLAPKEIVDFAYPKPVPAPGEAGATGNHGIDLAAVQNWLYFIEPRTGMIGRLTVDSRTGSLSDPVQSGGFDPGPEPFPPLDPTIESFLIKCFPPYSDANTDGKPDAHCKLGSAQGITGF
jgi:hypothetical protein